MKQVRCNSKKIQPFERLTMETSLGVEAGDPDPAKKSGSVPSLDTTAVNSVESSSSSSHRSALSNCIIDCGNNSPGTAVIMGGERNPAEDSGDSQIKENHQDSRSFQQNAGISDFQLHSNQEEPCNKISKETGARARKYDESTMPLSEGISNETTAVSGQQIAVSRVQQSALCAVTSNHSPFEINHTSASSSVNLSGWKMSSITADFDDANVAASPSQAGPNLGTSPASSTCSGQEVFPFDSQRSKPELLDDCLREQGYLIPPPDVKRDDGRHKGNISSSSQNSLSKSPEQYTPPSSLSTTTAVHRNYSQNSAQGGDDALNIVERVSASSVVSSLDPQHATPVSTTHTSSGRGLKPVLYSAIGSLEHTNNIGSFRQRMTTSSARDFAKPQGKNGGRNETTSTLIPPSALALMPRAPQNTKKSALTLSVQSSQTQVAVKAPSKSTIAAVRHQEVGKSIESENGSVQHSGRAQTDPVSTMKAVGGVLVSKKTEAGSKGRKIRKPNKKKVTIDESSEKRKSKRTTATVQMFRPSCDAYTPRMERKDIKYKPAEMRTSVEEMSTTMGSISRPNFRDALRRVAMIIHQHICKIERRFETGVRGEDDTGLFQASMRDTFREERFITPRYKCTMVRLPMARPGLICGLRKIHEKCDIPTEEEIYEFAHQLFNAVQLSSECSIVCLIYVERLMEVAKVPLMACTWRPIFMCGLLLASKVWQDFSSWNIEFASVYPQFSLAAINRLELEYLRMVKWDLHISSSLYAKYYFALRSLLEKPDFRQRYNRMIGGVGSVQISEALKIQKRTEVVKEEAISHFLSRSM